MRSPSTRFGKSLTSASLSCRRRYRVCEARTIGFGRFGLRLPSDGDPAQIAICAPPATVPTHRSDVWRLVRFTTIDHRLRRLLRLLQAATPPATAARLPVVPSFTHGQQTFHRPHEGRPAKSLHFGSRVERVVHRCAYRCAREVTPSEGLCASTAVELTEMVDGQPARVVVAAGASFALSCVHHERRCLSSIARPGWRSHVRGCPAHAPAQPSPPR